MLEAWVMVLGGSSVALQLSSQRSNVDFKPIVDHYSAVEYATKYATKKEKGSKPFDRWCARLNSGGRAEAESVAQSVAAEESSVLQYIATCVNAVALVLVGVLLERARSRRADTPRRPLEQPCSEPAPTRCSRSEPCAPPAPAPPAPPARTVSVPASTPADAPLCDVITDDRAKRCSASYCLRRDKHGKDRFGFPRQHHPHADHLAARRLLA